MIKIDWAALGTVSLVTLCSTLIVVGLTSVAAALLDRGHIAATEGHIESPYHSRYAWIAFILLGLVVAIVGYGLYLMIPWWH